MVTKSGYQTFKNFAHADLARIIRELMIEFEKLEPDWNLCLRKAHDLETLCIMEKKCRKENDK